MPLLFLLSASLSHSFSMSGQLGLRLVWKVGMTFLNFRPISNFDGEYPQANGMDLYANSPLDGSFSFFGSDLVVSTACLPHIGLSEAGAACLMPETPLFLQNE